MSELSEAKVETSMSENIKCDWMQSLTDVDLSSDMAVWISAIAAIVTAVTVLLIGLKAAKIAKYQASQADRVVIKNLYGIYSDAIRLFMPTASFETSVYASVLQKLYEGSDLASLYGLDDIATFFTSLIEDFNQGKESYDRCYDSKGNVKDSHNGDDISLYSDVARRLLSDYLENKNMQTFRKYLHIKP